MGDQLSVVDLVAFLDGRAPIGDTWFGDSDDSGKPFWWRAHLPLILSLQEQLARAEDALKPFARDFDEAGVHDSVPDGANWDDVDCCKGGLTVGDFRKARSTLSPNHSRRVPE
jgi:hypothetical protein